MSIEEQRYIKILSTNGTDERLAVVLDQDNDNQEKNKEKHKSTYNEKYSQKYYEKNYKKVYNIAIDFTSVTDKKSWKRKKNTTTGATGNV